MAFAPPSLLNALRISVSTIAATAVLATFRFSVSMMALTLGSMLKRQRLPS